MHSPTQRELLLVVVLFIALLTFSSTRLSNQGLSRIDLSSIWHELPPPPKTYSIPTLPSDTRLSWGTSKVPKTRMIAHDPGEFVFNVHFFMLTLLQGWTIFDTMYIYNGTVYLVNDEPETFPDLKFITSPGIYIDTTPENAVARLPTDKDMRIISTSEARKLFGTGATRVQGVTVRSHRPTYVIHLSYVASSGSSTIPSNSQYSPPLS